MRTKNNVVRVVYHIFVFGFGLIMLYPLIWMVMSSFKETYSIFATASSLVPEQFTGENYVNGWKGFAGVSFGRFFRNSLYIAVVGTVGTLFSCSLVAFGLERLNFRGKKLLFGILLATLMLPGQVLMVPQYLWFNTLGWVGSYLPLMIPCFFGTNAFIVYLMMNFIGGIPKDLDEAAKMDGCSYLGIYSKIVLPLMKPALITGTIFTFIARWDDFMGPLLYVNDSASYPVSLALKLFCDPGSSSDYGAMFAMATLSLLPVVMLFIFFQKYLVQGVATSGLKG